MQGQRSDLFPPSDTELVACVEREIRLRRQVYPRRIAAGRMSQKTAEKEIALMEAVLKRLQGLQS